MKKRIVLWLTVFIMILCALPSNILSYFSYAETKDTLSYSDEIWNSETNTFNKNVISEIIDIIASKEDILNDYPVDEIYEMAALTTSYDEWLERYPLLKEYNAKLAFTIGGLKWLPMYISTNKQGDVIFTMWLDDESQSAWSGYEDGYKVEENSSAAFYNGSYYSTYGVDGNYMYGTSQVRTYGLNNASNYVYAGTDENGEIIYSTYVQNENHPFALFTSPTSEFTKYIVKPSEVEWQEYQSVDLYETDSNGEETFEIFDMLNYYYSMIDLYSNMIGEEYAAKELSNNMLMYCETILTSIMTPTNDAWSNNTICSQNQEELLNIIDLYMLFLDLQIEENSDDQAVVNEIESQKQEILMIIEEFLPHVAVDSYGNYYNYYSTGGLNYEKEAHYSDWKNDYLWLPSASEMAPLEMGANSIWDLKAYLLNNNKEEVSSDALYTNNILSRSAIYGGAIKFNAEGSDFSYTENGKMHAIRPAFHLNFTKIINDLALDQEKSRYVRVDEIWDEENKIFNLENLSTLYSYITGLEQANVNEINTILNSSGGVFSAEDIRNNVVGKKGEGKDVIVRIGGYDWYVTYLSKSKNEEPVLTLWLSNSVQAKNSYNKKFLFNYLAAYLDGSIFCLETSDIYSRSSLRSYALNNTANVYMPEFKGSLLVDEDGFLNYTAKASHPFALFTDQNLEFTQYLTTPRNMAWQEYQNAYTLINVGSSFSNDAWSSDIEDGVNDYHFNVATNYAGQPYYSDWADDYLWLPSGGEIYAEEYVSSSTGEIIKNSGLWGLGVNQITNYDQESSEIEYINEEMVVPTSYLLRSGTSYNSSYGLISVDANGKDYSINTASGLVRPAMHLNLSSLPNVFTEGLNIKSSRSIYSASSKLGNIGFVLDGENLTLNSDYTFTCYLGGEEVSDIVNAGVYTIVFNGLGEYSEYQGVEFFYTVAALNIESETTVEILEIPTYVEGETTEIIPTVNVYYNSNLLTEGIDYTLEFLNNTSPTAKAKCIVRFIGNYTGSKTKTFLIAGINLSKVEITSSLNQTNYYCDMVTIHKYDLGNIYAEGILLKENIDYTWYYLNPETDIDDKTNNIDDKYFIEPGVVIIVIEGMGNYSGMAIVWYEIDPIDISRLTHSIDQNVFEYTGDYIYPKITAKFGDKVLVEDVDYTLSYYNNKNAGTQAEVTIIFSGDYTGSMTYYFTITPIDLSLATLKEAFPEYVYQGRMDPVYFDFDLVYGEKTLGYSDYTYSLRYVQKAGTFNIVCTGTGNFVGTKTLTVTVKKAEIKKIDVWVSGNYSFDFAGFYYNQYDIEKKDYNVVASIYIEDADGEEYSEIVTDLISLKNNFKAYRNGVETTDFKNVGDITFKFFDLSFENCYQAEGTNFESVVRIIPDTISSATLTTGNIISFITYDGLYHSDKLIVSSEYTETLSTDDYIVKFYKYDTATEEYSTEPLDRMIDAGTYKWTITSNSANYVVSTGLGGTIYILNKNILDVYKQYFYINDSGEYVNSLGEVVSEKVFVTGGSGDYAGLPLGVEVYFSSSKDRKLEEGIDYTVIKDDSLLESEKKYTVTISAVEGSNYTGSYTLDFYINLYRIDAMNVSLLKTFVYNLGQPIEVDGANDLTIYNPDIEENLTFETDFSFYTGNIKIDNDNVYVNKYINNINAGTATLYIQGNGKYIGTRAIKFTITPLNILSEKVEGEFALESQEFSYTKKEIKPAVTHQTLALGTDFSVVYSNNTNVGIAKVNIVGVGNYNGSTELNFEIKVKYITDSNIYFSPDIKDSYVFYNSENAIKNQITLKYDLTSVGGFNTTLSASTDYTLKFYRNGEETYNQKDVGVVTVVIEGRNGFAGSITFDFVIEQKSIAGTSCNTNLLSTYDYKPGKTVELEVRDNTKNMVEGVDYEAVFKRNGVETYDLISAGIIEYEITGINNYKDKIVGSFKIEKGAIIKFTQDKYEYTYNREIQKPIPIDVYDKKEDIIFEDEYILKYYVYNSDEQTYEEIPSSQMDFITPGQYKIIAQANKEKDNYDGSCEAIYIINKKSLADIIGSTELENLFKDQEFTNSDIKQDIQLNFGDYGLVEGEDYKVIYENNKDTGKVEVKIEGLGNYAGSLDTSFEITSKPMDEIVLENGIGVSDLVIVKEYTGSNVSLEDSDFFELIPYGDGYLVPGVDFTYVHKDEERIEMGNYIVTLSGIGNYMNSVDITMQIAAISFNTHLETESIQPQIFTGYAITPQLTFYIDGVKTDLTLNYDYKIKYSNNTNVGHATITVEGMGYYSGLYQTTFQIVPAEIEKTERFTFNYTSEYTYSSQPVSLDLVSKYQSSQDVAAINLIYNKDFTVVVYRDNNKNQTYESNIDELYLDPVVNAHSYLVELKGKDNYSGSIYLPLTINKLNISDAIESGLVNVLGVEQSYVYTGSAINPIVAIIFKDKDISQTDFVIDYDENTNVVTGGLVTIETKETSNFSGLLVKNFVIEKATIVVEVGLYNNNEFLYVGDKLPKIIVLNEIGVDGELTFENENEKLILGSKEYKWIFTPTDVNNYNVVMGTIKITAIEKESFPWIIIGLGFVVLGAIIMIFIIVKKRKKKKNNEKVDSSKLKQLSQIKEQDVENKNKQ